LPGHNICAVNQKTNKALKEITGTLKPGSSFAHFGNPNYEKDL